MLNRAISGANKTAGRVYMAVLTTALMLGIVAAPAATRADTLQQTQAYPTITIAGGATATLTARGFCLDFGRPFPTGDVSASGLAAERVRAAVNYSIQKGYSDANAVQVQQAVWYLRDNTWHAEQRTIAEEIVANATTANVPATTGDGVSVADAVTQNRVTVTARFVPQTADAFYGDGEVTIRNTGTAEIKLFMPIGVVFTARQGDAFQDLVAYQLAVQQATTTPGATASPATTQQATAIPTITAITTPQGTTTVTGTVGATTTVVGTVGATTTAVGTAEATTIVAATTPTVMETATVAVETATAMPTVEVATATPEVTTQAAPGTLPATGANDGTMLVMIAMAMAIALGMVGTGALLARKRRY